MTILTTEELNEIADTNARLRQIPGLTALKMIVSYRELVAALASKDEEIERLHRRVEELERELPTEDEEEMIRIAKKNN